tara:strand:- start:253 stop:555 length:303 start_codon:yes stop_codon:yes gene_type:complete
MGYKNHVKLNSVGAFFDTHQGIVYPMLSDGTKDFEGVDVMVHEPEWFNSLSLKDFDVVEKYFNSEELDIEAMLLGMDGLTFDNPKDEYDFDMAMNGIEVY